MDVDRVNVVIVFLRVGETLLFFFGKNFGVGAVLVDLLGKFCGNFFCGIIGLIEFWEKF